jgi:hypothetical protein
MTMFYREDSSDNRGFNQRRPTLKELHEPMRVDEGKRTSDHEVESAVKSTDNKTSDVKFGWIRGVLVKHHYQIDKQTNKYMTYL